MRFWALNARKHSEENKFYRRAKQMGGLVGGCIGGLIPMLVGQKGGGDSGIVDKRSRPREQVDVIDYFQGSGGCMKGAVSGLNDKKFDELLAQRIQPLNIFNMAIAKLGLDPSQVQEVNPVYLDGYYYSRNSEGLLLAKTGKDGITRCSKYVLSAILFGQEQVYMYSYCFDLATYEVEEKAAEYFYSEVESITVSTYDEEKRYSTGCFSAPTLGTAQFIVVSLHTGGDAFYTSVRPENMPAINGMRNLIRDRKNR
jgi:hypothetical protein